MSKRTHDIAIVGGGLVGASLACAVAPLGYRVAVIEAVPPRATAQPSYDDRTLALNHASCEILRGLGLWSSLAGRITPIREVVVTELGRPGRVVLQPQELGRENFGHVIEARAFGEAVTDRLAGLDEVELICPARVTGVVAGDECLTVEVANGGAVPRQLSARLLVGADGARSTVRSLLGLSAREKDYGQTAVICNVTPAVPHDGRAFERLTPTGPFALLPHLDGRCGLVWCVAAGAAEALLELPEREFLQGAAERSGGVLGRLTRLGRRSSYPLLQVIAERDVAPRALLLGNAAHTVHPAGAQGFNLGLRDVAVLVELLQDAGRAGMPADPGDADLLAAYSDWRRPDQVATAAWTDGLVGLFASRAAATAAARSLGLFAHTLLPPLRRRLASQAMGYRGRVPRLALGGGIARGESA